MYIITVDRTFTAKHQLTLPKGDLETLHNHNWVIRAAVSSDKLDEIGTVLDFNILKQMIDDIVKPFIDKNLEDFECFKKINASAENLAEYIYFQLKKLLNESLHLLYIEITEEPGCSARYCSEISI